MFYGSSGGKRIEYNMYKEYICIMYYQEIIIL